MKQTKLWLATIAALLCSLTASAHDFEVGGIYYKITSSADLTVEVTYRGSYYNSYSNEYSGAVTLPSTVTYNSKTYSVTSIGSSVFCGCSSLTAINIPESVTSIGSGTFWECSSLKEVIIEDGNTTLSLGCNEYDSELTGQGLFYDCPLERVYLGRNLSYNTETHCGYSPFYNRRKLTSVTIGDNVTSIGALAFYQCSSLTYIAIGESVTSIGEDAFRECSSLASIAIPESVTSIGSYAFWYCSSLASITFAENSQLTSIGGSAFDDTPWYSNLPDGVVYISNVLYEYRGAMSENTSITIPESVTSIGGGAFAGCSNLVSITIPESVTKIGVRAFYGCSSLTYITIPEGVTSIGGSTFDGCSSLTSITIPEGVTSIGGSTFDGCSSLVSITFAGNSQLTSIGSSAFCNCSSLTSITIPESVTKIGNYAFEGCTSLKEVIIEDGSTTLSLGYQLWGYTLYGGYYTGQGLFYDCPLEKVYLGRNLRYEADYRYGYSPFYNKDALTNVVISNDVTEIGEYAFYRCDNLHSVTIGSGVRSIGDDAFSTPKKVIWLTNTRPTGYAKAEGSINYVIANYQYTSFENMKVYPYLSSMFEVEGVKYVPVSPTERTCDAIDCAYNSTAAAINVSETVSFKGDDMTVKEVMPFTFYGNKHIKEVSVSHKGNVGNYAFYDCGGITDVVASNQGSIGSHAFSGCCSISSLAILEGVTSIGTCTFFACSNFTSLDIPETVTSIGNSAFSACRGITSITIPESVTSIVDNSFIDCSNVEDLIVKGSAMPYVPSDKLKLIMLYSPAPLKSKGFSPTVYQNCMLYVPQQGLARYQVVEPWIYFWNIAALESSDVAPAEVTDDDSVPIIYDLRGQRVDVPTKGVYIIDGRKVVVK